MGIVINGLLSSVIESRLLGGFNQVCRELLDNLV